MVHIDRAKRINNIINLIGGYNLNYYIIIFSSKGEMGGCKLSSFPSDRSACHFFVSFHDSHS